MSFLSDLFVVKVRSIAGTTEKGNTRAAGASDSTGAKESGVPVFLTVKTLGSFATGTFFVTLVWKLLKVMLPASDWVVSPWTAAGIALVHGLAVFCASVSDPDAFGRLDARRALGSRRLIPVRRLMTSGSSAWS